MSRRRQYLGAAVAGASDFPSLASGAVIPPPSLVVERGEVVGVRFVFPPHEDNQQTSQVRVETWPQDPRSIWIENASSYANPLPAAEMPRVADQLAATYNHVTGPVCSFLAKLDTQDI